MKLLIPSAKDMNEGAVKARNKDLSTKSRRIIEAFNHMSLEEMAVYYKIKPERAEKEAARWQELAAGTAQTYPALCLYDGLMYRSINRSDLTDQELAYIDEHLMIATALYGMIPAREAISPHRLDFLGPSLFGNRGQSLKNLWKENYDQLMATDELLISLLSDEFESVFSRPNRDRLVRAKFMESKDGVYKIHSTISKKGRGAFVSACCQKGLTQLDQMRELEFEGFVYRKDLSSDRELVYVKEV